MTHARSKFFWPMGAALATLLLASGAYGQQSSDAEILLAQSEPDCYAIGQRVAAEQGGTLARASAESRGGRTICKIVVLVPGKNGERPRRAEFTVPAQ